LGLDVIGSDVVVSWPGSYGDFPLQSATVLGASNTWSNLPNTPIVVGSQLVVTNPINGPVRYYRLVNQ
jgi:hypothetical protein